MILWLSAMTLALALALAVPVERGQKLRVWGMMIAGLPAAFIYPSPWLYIAIDLVIAWVVMAHPKSTWQRAIGICYVGMALLTLGYIIRDIAVLQNILSAANSPQMLSTAHEYLGWGATVLLITWGANGVARKYRNNHNNSRDMVASKQGRVR